MVNLCEHNPAILSTAILENNYSEHVSNTDPALPKMVSKWGWAVMSQYSECEDRDSEDIFRCLAFPERIPTNIHTNEISHTNPTKASTAFA
jgi:hypothetical protein